MSFRPEAIETAITIGMILDSSSDYRDELWFLKRGEYKQLGGLKHASGMYRTAFIFEDFIVKVVQSESRMQELRKEAEAIEVFRSNPDTGRHFPDTFTFEVGKVIVQLQEKVNMSHKGVTSAVHGLVEALGESLGIDDCHNGNYGWKRGKNGNYPVFVDVDFRMKARKRGKPVKVRSWMLL